MDRDAGRLVAASFEAFFDSSWSKSFELAFVILGDRQAAEDVTQDVYARAYLRWSRIEAPDAYVRRAIVNACRDQIRHRQRQRRLLSLLQRERPPTSVVPDPIIDQLQRLSAAQQVVVVLRVHYQLSDSEIAARTGWPLGTVKSHLRRGLARIEEADHD